MRLRGNSLLGVIQYACPLRIGHVESPPATVRGLAGSVLIPRSEPSTPLTESPEPMPKTPRLPLTPTALRRLGLFTVLLVTLIVGGLVTAGSGVPEDIGNAWDDTTPLATSTPNDCHLQGQRCAEWCTLYQDGTARGTGLLCCVSDEQMNSGSLASCIKSIR